MVPKNILLPLLSGGSSTKTLSDPACNSNIPKGDGGSGVNGVVGVRR